MTIHLQAILNGLKIQFSYLEKKFHGLPERILSNMKKYYFDSTDNVDKLNFLKQFLTSTDLY